MRYSFILFKALLILLTSDLAAQPCAVSINPASAAVCTGNSVTLTATGGSSGYMWSPATGLSAVTGATITATPGSTITYMATAVGCTGSAKVVVTVNALPDATVTTNDPLVSCDSIFAFPSVTFSGIPAQNNSTYLYSFHFKYGNSADYSSANFSLHIFNFKPGFFLDTMLVTVLDITTGCSAVKNIPIYNGFHLNVKSSTIQIAPLNFQDGSSLCSPFSFRISVIANGKIPPGTVAIIGTSASNVLDTIAYFGTDTLSFNINLNSCGLTYNSLVSNAIQFLVALKNLYCSPEITTISRGPIYMSSMPMVNFSYTPKLCEGVLNFENESVFNLVDGNGCYSNYNSFWTIFDSTNTSIFTSTSQNLSYDFPPGNYKIKLKAISSASAFNTSFSCYQDSLEKDICVLPNPSCSFTAQATANCSLTVITNNTSTGAGDCGSLTYAYSTTGTPSTSTLKNPTFTFGSAGTQTINLTVANEACTAVSCSQQVTLYSAPSFTINLLSNACDSATECRVINVNNGGAPTTFSWSAPGATPSSSTSANPCFHYNNDGNYLQTLIATNMCGSFVEKDTLSITQSPKITIGPDDSLCNGTCKTLKALITRAGTSPYTYKINGTSETADSLQVCPTTTDLNVAVVTDAKGCMASDTMKLIIKQPDALTITQSNQISCNGDTAKLSITGGKPPYFWSPKTGLNTTKGSSITANPTITTTYTVTGGSAGGDNCGSIAIYILNVPVPLTVHISPTDTTVCNGNSVQLSIVPDTFKTYAWSPATSLSSTNSPGVTSSPVSSITYTITVKDSKGCSAKDSVAIQVVQASKVKVSANVNTICKGGNASLSASVPVGIATYTWSPALGLSATTGSAVTANPNITTTYICRASFGSAGGCFSEDTIILTVIQPPILILNNDTTLCGTGSVKLSASGAANYLWAPSNGLNLLTGSSVIASPVLTTTYMVIGTGSNGCTSSKEVVITIAPVPQINILVTNSNFCHKNSTCFGNEVNLQAQVTGGNSFTWIWNTSPAALTQSISEVVTKSFLYIVTVTNSSNCSSDTSVFINVLPPPNGQISGDRKICYGDTIHLFASGGDSYAWYPGRLVSDSTSSNPVARVTKDTTLSVIITDSATCCSVTKEIHITVVPPLTVTIHPFTSTICAGYPVELSAKGPKFTTYLWSPATMISDALDGSAILTPDTTLHQPIIKVSVLAFDSNHCAARDTVQIRVQYPIRLECAGSICLCSGDAPVALCSGGDTSGIYNWSPAEGLNETNSCCPKASPTDSTTYIVTARDKNGCFVNSATISVCVRPLPTTAINQSGDSLVSAETATKYQWYNSSGAIINGAISQVYVPEESGAYIIKITDENGCSDYASKIFTFSHKIYVPNAFSPNGDGKNDVFNVLNKNIKDIDMFIYNRWGEMIFETTLINIGWNGTFNGEPESVNTYVYYIKATFIDGASTTEKGNVTLLR